MKMKTEDGSWEAVATRRGPMVVLKIKATELEGGEITLPMSPDDADKLGDRLATLARQARRAAD